MDVSTHLLRMFLVVADTGSFTRAAAALYVSQPAVSDGIRRLESVVEAPLFSRRPGGVELTEAGTVLLTHVRRALHSLDQGVSAARTALGAAPLIVVYQSPTIAADWLPPLLDRWVAVLDGADRIEERELPLGAWPDALLSGAADLALVHQAAQVDGLVATHIGDDDLWVALGTALADSLPAGAVDLRDLATLPLLIWHRDDAPAFYDLVVGAFHARGIEPEVDPHLQRTTTRVSRIARGEAIAVLPEQAARSPQPGLSYRPIIGGLRARVDLVSRATDDRPDVLRAVQVARRGV